MWCCYGFELGWLISWVFRFGCVWYNAVLVECWLLALEFVVWNLDLVGFGFFLLFWDDGCGWGVSGLGIAGLILRCA